MTEQKKEPPFEHPKDHALPENWKEKEASKWPMWVGVGVIVVVIALIVSWGVGVPKWAQSPQSDAPHALTTPPPADAPANRMDLIVNGIYKVSAPTPLLGRPNAVEDAPGAKMLPAESEIIIVSAQMVEGTKWYEVKTADSAGNSTGKGWVSSTALQGQKLILVRDAP
jgi:hypothetical protein